MTADTAHVFILCETNCTVQTRRAAKQSVPVCVKLQGVTFRGLGLFGVRLSRLRSLRDQCIGYCLKQSASEWLLLVPVQGSAVITALLGI